MPNAAQLNARLEAISVVLQEVCRTLSPPQLAAVAAASRTRLNLASAGVTGNELADEAMSVEVAQLLGALHQASS